jgi:hypothetical protein
MPDQSALSINETAIKAIARELKAGRLALFLGAGANMCGRPKDFCLHQNLPRGGELAEYLLQQLELPIKDDYKSDLARASGYAILKSERLAVYDELHTVFDGNFEPTPLHKLVAELPGLCDHHQYVVTTNYDDVMERAFASKGEPFDVVWYDLDEKTRGFWHLCVSAQLQYPPDAEHAGLIDDYVKKIEDPTRFVEEVDFEQRSVIFKVHGAVWRWAQPRDRLKRDSYVIAEDDYIDYMAFTHQLPAGLVSEIQRRNMLFLGYSLRDWNMRVILRQAWGDRRLPGRAWAVLDQADDLEEIAWANRGVTFLVMKLEEFTEQLGSHLRGRPLTCAATGGKI